MAWMRVLIPIFVFMHGFLTAPLLVECIPQDGRGIVEIMGQDPCHEDRLNHPAPAGKGTGRPAVTDMCKEVDSCTDLMLDSPAATKACTDLSVSPPQAGA